MREFFAPRAAGWEDRFPDDDPAYAAAVEALAPPLGGVALDAGCGTGRALPLLAAAVGPQGLVVGLDATPEMCAEATGKGRGVIASLVIGDVDHLPLEGGRVDAILAAGVGPSTERLVEWARVTRPRGRLALFHPISRAALAERHGSPVDPGDVRADPAVRSLLRSTGWEPELVDDGPHRYLVVARNAG